MANIVKPYGLPSWSRSASIEDYGGSVTKYDLLGVGPINFDTDISAAQIASLSSHLAAIMRVSPLCVIQMSNVTGAYSITNFISQWGNGLSFAPTLTEDGFSFTLTFDSSYTDEYGQSQAINIKSVNTTIGLISSGSGADPQQFYASYTIVSPNEVDFICKTVDSDDFFLTITVY